MKTIDVSGLQRGDILLTTTTERVSKAIRFGTRSDISHAMIYVAGYSVIDSTLEGVHARNTQRLYYEDDCAIHALRLKEPLSAQRLNKVIDYARVATGTPYSTSEALSSMAKPQGKGGEKQFCSRLVARAFAEAGVMLVENPDFCTPAQLKNSPLLYLLPAPVVQASENEEKSRGEDGTVFMREITNSFLGQARKIFPGVNSIQDALDALRAAPQEDLAIFHAYQSSGYLDFWRYEVDTNPWRYDIEEMVRFAQANNCASTVTEYCLDTIEHHEAGDYEHWAKNEVVAEDIARTTRLITFHALEALYANLNASNRARVEAAREWLTLRAIRHQRA